MIRTITVGGDGRIVSPDDLAGKPLDDLLNGGWMKDGDLVSLGDGTALVVLNEPPLNVPPFDLPGAASKRVTRGKHPLANFRG